MKRYYIASLCRNGVLGGTIYASDDCITFKTGKVTVPQSLKNLTIKYGDMQSFRRKWIFCFPVFSISLKNGENYTFIVFSPQKFTALLNGKISP